MLALKLGIRNLFRNVRRTLISLSMLSGGFCAVVLFNGFSANMIRQLEYAVVHSQYGHFQIGTPSIWDSSIEATPEARWLPASSAALDGIRANPNVSSVSGRTQFYGLVSSDANTLSARGIAFDPLVESETRKSYTCIQGETLQSNSAFEVMVGSGLAHHLRVSPGSRLTVVAQTLTGAMNAIDFEVKCIFRTSVQEIDEVTFVIPLALSGKLLDTDRVEKWVVTLKPEANFNQMTTFLKTWSANQNPKLELKTWHELATLYNQVTSFFDTQNGFLSFIMTTIVFLGILNTLGMSVLERVSEIGTVRAMGDKRKEVIQQFVLEGAFLALLGTFLGILLTFLMISIINHLHMPIVMPNSSAPLIISIDVVPSAFIRSFCLLFVSSLIASYIPSSKACRMPIVEALRHH